MNAFDGVRVVEIATGVTGPMAAAFFADFGADVIKVEPPAGDPGRATPAFVAFNRGKRAVVADAAVPDDRAAVQGLLVDADLVVVRRSTDLEEWGVDPNELSTRPGGPVVLELPPFQGPAPWYGEGESQALLAAVSGYARRQSSFDGGPVDMVYPHLLYVQSALGATAAVAALVERLLSGLGQIVTVDGMHAVSEMFTGNYSLDPNASVIDTAVGPRGLNPTYSHYQASDGTWFLVGGLTPKFQERILRAIGEEWIIDDPRIAGDLSAVFSPENRDWVRDVVSGRFETRPRTDWIRVLRDAGVPVAPLNTPEEAFEHDHTRVLGLPVTINDPTFGRVTIVGPPVTAERTPAAITAGAPIAEPAAAASWRARVGAPVGVGWAGATGGRPTGGGPLSGVRVLLVGTFVAGPFGAFLLGHMGADVIKIESPGGDPWRERGFYYSDGMRSIVVDLKKPEGREVFRSLAEGADVIVDNLRPGVGAGLGVDYPTIAAYNPDVVTVSLTGFGQSGPLAMEPGFDPVLQAWSGQCVAQGGDDIPVLYTVPVNDVSAAALIAFGACTGLFHRMKTGEGQAISTSLVAASMYMQSAELVRGEFPPLLRRGGRDFTGPSELDRYYRTKDGWVRVQASVGTTVGDVRDALGVRASDDLEAAFATVDSTTAVDRLTAAQVPAAIARQHRDVVVSGDHPGRFTHRRPEGPYTYYRPQQYMSFSRSSYEQDMYPPGAGEHTTSILEELDLGADERERLVDSCAVIVGEPMKPRILNPYR